jgi:hypothetical protein
MPVENLSAIGQVGRLEIPLDLTRALVWSSYRPIAAARLIRYRAQRTALRRSLQNYLCWLLREAGTRVTRRLVTLPKREPAVNDIPSVSACDEVRLQDFLTGRGTTPPYSLQTRSFGGETNMAVYIVTYDPRKPGKDYTPVHDYLKQFAYCNGYSKDGRPIAVTRHNSACHGAGNWGVTMEVSIRSATAFRSQWLFRCTRQHQYR